ncbi:hypothetical protein Syun_027182 [Stephania yunnanensis]|uniref:Uncharacterized protein n=1 Tax=Stephania yunnanensis TaxID=152371 RepID=A0AAP0EF81_9MAGN
MVFFCLFVERSIYRFGKCPVKPSLNQVLPLPPIRPSEWVTDESQVLQLHAFREMDKLIVPMAFPGDDPFFSSDVMSALKSPMNTASLG